MFRIVVGALLTAGFAAVPAALAEAPKSAPKGGLSNLVPVSSLPTAVTEAADKASPKTKWLIAKKVPEGEVNWYAILARDSQNRLVEYRVREDGTKGYVRVEIPMDHVPEPVISTLQRERPDLKVKSVQFTGYTVDNILAYRFTGQTPSGERSVLVGADGRKVMDD